jgi:transposase
MFQRQQGKHLPLQDKGVIVGMHKLRTPVTDIAEVVGCHRETVRRWIQRYEGTLDVTRRLGSGRPHKTTPLDDARLLAAVRAKPNFTIENVRKLNFIKNFKKFPANYKRRECTAE